MILNRREIAMDYVSCNVTVMTNDIKYCNCTIFFIGFPKDCSNFQGPNDVKCYTDIWYEVGCITSGRLYPGSVPESELKAFERMTLM